MGISRPESEPRLIIRPARPTEAQMLSKLARAAKASNGYPRSWLDAWKSELTLTPAFIEVNPVFVAEGAADRTILGVVALEDGDEGPEIAHLWVLPGNQRGGIGRKLVDRAVEESRSRGWRDLRILSDPNAVSFYEQMGAVRVGTHPAPVAGTQRELPVLRLAIELP